MTCESTPSQFLAKIFTIFFSIDHIKYLCGLWAESQLLASQITFNVTGQDSDNYTSMFQCSSGWSIKTTWNRELTLKCELKC